MRGQSKLTLTAGRLILLGLIAPGLITAVMASGGCNNNTESPVRYSTSGPADCLPDIKLIDQYGSPFSLASLKGRPVLVDFFYTTCPGPCLVLTARMRSIADKLGTNLGAKASFVSVTVDPKRDTPSRLLAYAKEQRAERKGWIFLTGTPAQVDALMARFKLVRPHEADGSVVHVLEFFLVGPDGRLRDQYIASEAHPATIAADIQEAAAQSLAVNARLIAPD